MSMMFYDEYIERRDEELNLLFHHALRYQDIDYEEFCLDQYFTYLSAFLKAFQEGNR